MKKRTRYIWVLLSLTLLLVGIGVPAFADEEKPTGDVSMTAASKYVWRGYELSRNSLVIQPSVTVGYKGFSANIWGNLDTKPYSTGTDKHASTLNETDVTLAYSKTLGKFNLGAGYIYYGLSSLTPASVKRADMTDIYASVGLNTILSPTLTVYREVSHYHNWYALLAVSHTFELYKRVGLKLGASASYLASTYADATLFNAGAGYGGYPKFDSSGNATNDKFNGFHDGVLTAALPIKVTDYITVTPSVTYIFPLTGDAKDEMKGNGLAGASSNADRDSSYLYGGVTASFTF